MSYVAILIAKWLRINLKILEWKFKRQPLQIELDGKKSNKRKCVKTFNNKIQQECKIWLIVIKNWR